MTPCKHCGRDIWRTKSGAWYHRHNASIRCHPNRKRSKEVAEPKGLI